MKSSQLVVALNALQELRYCKNVKELHVNLDFPAYCCNSMTGFECEPGYVLLALWMLKCEGKITITRMRQPLHVCKSYERLVEFLKA